MEKPHCYGKMDWILKYPEDETPKESICDCQFTNSCLRITRNKNCKTDNLKRNYVIVCNEHKGIAGSLLFWGTHSKDEEKRSFGGYTSDFNACEKYTLKEIEDSNYSFPVYGKGVNHDNYRKVDDFVIEIKRLRVLDCRPMLIYYR